MHPEIITGVVKREKDDDDLSDTTDIENEIISNDISFHGDLDSGNESLSPPVVRQLVPGQMPTSCLPADTDYEPVLELEPVEEMVDESGCRIKAWRCDECDLRFQYFASFQKHNDREHPGQPLIPQSRRWDVDDEESDASDYVMDTAYLVDSDDSDYAPSKQKQKKKTTTRRKSTGRRTGRPPKNDPPLPKVWVRGPYKKRDRMTSQYASWSEPIARKRRGRPPRSENQVEVPKEEPTQCSACPLIFDTRALANSHYRRNHFLPYHCLLCNKRFDAFKKYYIHSEMVHDTVVDDVLEASLSDAGDSDPEDCRVNVEGRTEPVLHPCDMCPNLYPTEIVLSGHKLRRHADEIPDMAVIESLKRKWRSRFQPENIEAHETALKQLGPISDERKKAGLPDQKSKRGQNRPRNSGLSEEEKLRRAEAKLLRRKIRKATGVRLKATTFGLRGQDGKFVPGYRKSDEEKELTHRLAAIRKAERRRLLYQAQKEAREKGLPVPRNLKEAGIEYEPYTTHPHFRKAIEADPVNIQKLLLAATISDRLPDDLAPKSTPELDDATHEIAELDESTGVSRPKRQSAIDAIGTIKEFTKKLGTVRVDKGEELDPERDQNANQAEKEIEDRMKRNEEYDDDFHMTDDEEPEEEDDDSDYEEEKEKEKDSIAAYRRLGRQRLEEIAAAALKQVQEQVAAASEGTSAVENGENGTPAEEGEGSKKLTLVEKALRSLGIMKESKRGPRPGMKRGPYKKTREGKDESAICPFTGKILSSGRRRRRKDMSRDDINAERREKYPRKNESTYYKPRKDTCRKCNMEFEDDTELCRHAKSVHFDPASGDRFVFSRDDPNGYQAMLRRGKKAFACQREGCETQKFAYFEFLSKHMLDVHQEKLMDEDGEEVPTTPSDKYLETNPWTKCAECDHVVRQASMRRHKQYLHTPEGLPCPFPCDFPDCGRTFRGRLKLMWHRRSVHHELRDIPCKYCDKTFGTPYQARKHVRVHEGFRYQCSSCELSFKSNQGKINHELTVHSGKSPEFYCDEPGCNKVVSIKCRFVLCCKTTNHWGPQCNSSGTRGKFRSTRQRLMGTRPAMTGTPGTGSTSDPIPSQSLSSGIRTALLWTMARISLWPSMHLFLRLKESGERLMESLLLGLHVRLRLVKHQPNLVSHVQRKRLRILRKQIVPLNLWIWKDCMTRPSIQLSDQLSSLRSRSNPTCIALSMTS